ncbi:MAG: AraC family transcriptional regulator [Opitutus sp.]
MLPCSRPLHATDLVAVHAEHHRVNFWAEHEHSDTKIIVFFDGAPFDFTWRDSNSVAYNRNIAPGEVVFIRERVRHSWWLRRSADIATIFLSPRYLANLGLCAVKNLQVVSLTTLIRQAPMLAHLEQEMRMLCLNDGDVEHDYVTSLGLIFSLQLLHAEAKSRGVVMEKAVGLESDILRRVVTYIHDHLDCKLPVEELAEQARLTRAHFIERFKQSTGLPPHRYVVRERVLKALRLLLTTRAKLIDVSLECGFADQTHFANCFFDMLGYLPSEVVAGKTTGLSSWLMRRTYEPVH